MKGGRLATDTKIKDYFAFLFVRCGGRGLGKNMVCYGVSVSPCSTAWFAFASKALRSVFYGTFCSSVFYFISCFINVCKLISISIYDLVSNLHFKRVLILLTLEAGDIEMNPCPNTIKQSLLIIHSNDRSIQNKFDFITDDFLDFDILCFKETHLDANVLNGSLILTDKFDAPYQKNRRYHVGGLLLYLSHGPVYKCTIDLEMYWNESLCLEINAQRKVFLLDTFYIPCTSDANFFDTVNRNIENALDVTNNVIIVDNKNEDLLSPKVHNQRDILLLNSVNTIISQPTRKNALVDSIIIHTDVFL